jgi:NADPH:quinone reductase-like Zn-dependent oxidoreductase
MKSIIFQKYGTTNDLELDEVVKPACKSDEVLIKIHATSINDWDWGLLRGKPFINRLLFGVFHPKVKTLGIDISGTIEFAGAKTTKFKIGDEVFGDISSYKWGGFAEYVCVKENFIELKSPKMTFEEAAAMPQAGVLAIQGFLDSIKINPGQHILINGAGGGCGTFAIQIAKQLGAIITAVDKGSKIDVMLKLGADKVIDYSKEDFTKNIQTYDFILDFAGHHALLDYNRSLKENGTYLLVGGASGLIMKCIFFGSIISFFTKKRMTILQHEPNKYLKELIKLYEEGKLKIVIDRTFSLDQVSEALAYFGHGNAKGKIIISISKT